jgi:hypothetical protein
MLLGLLGPVVLFKGGSLVTGVTANGLRSRLAAPVSVWA